MIFVTVGTHEQPFNRLIKKIDELKQDGTIEEDVIIQTGFSTYEPKYCQWSKLIPYQQMVKNVADARIVITHGGPASFVIHVYFFVRTLHQSISLHFLVFLEEFFLHCPN